MWCKISIILFSVLEINLKEVKSLSNWNYTTVTLLIGYTLIQNKKCLKNRIRQLFISCVTFEIYINRNATLQILNLISHMNCENNASSTGQQDLKDGNFITKEHNIYRQEKSLFIFCLCSQQPSQQREKPRKEAKYNS